MQREKKRSLHPNAQAEALKNEFHSTFGCVSGCVRSSGIKKCNGLIVRPVLIPLDAGGDQFIACARGISEVEDEYLRVFIPEWLATKLRIEEGALVRVDNENGKLNIHPVNHPMTSAFHVEHNRAEALG